MESFINIEEADLDKPIYRIVNLDYVVEMLRNDSNILVSPKLWDDPFENILSHVKFNDVAKDRVTMAKDNLTYLQCWSYSSENDLLWRVYSPKGNSVRLKSTPRKLFECLNKSKTILSIKNNPSIIEFDSILDLPEYEGIEVFVGNVIYLTKPEIYSFLKNINHVKFKELISSLFIKREPFINENEFRIALWHCDTYNPHIFEIKSDFFEYQCIFNEYIDEIVFDPRLPQYKYEALSKTLYELGAQCTIAKSDIYEIPYIEI